MKEPKHIKIPRRLLLKAGAHIIVPGSTNGGTRKSTMIITVACVCALAGLNCTVITLDPYSQSLQQALGETVVRIPSITSESGRQSLLEIVEQAKTSNSIILMDMPSGFLEFPETHAAIRSYCDNFDSVGVIAPITFDQWDQKCAASAIELLQPDHVLLNYVVSRRMGSPLLESLSKYPCWQSEQWTQAMKSVFNRCGPYANLPPVTKIPAYLAEKPKDLDIQVELDLEDFMHDIEIAGAAIYTHLLEPITSIVES